MDDMDRDRSSAVTSGAGGTATLHIRGVIAEIELDNGPLNLVDKPLLRGLNAALRDASVRSDLRCLILHGGAKKAFCAGSDVREFEHLRADASEHKILFEDMVLRALAQLAVPTIAALDGHALGGGFELALACDLRVCRPGLKLGLTESRLGGLAGSGSVRLARLIGPSRAKELLYTGDLVDTERALQWGLVNRIAESGSALDAARELAAVIASRGPMSNRLAKTLVDASLDLPLDAALTLSTVHQQKIFDSRDLHEGVDAFRSRRDPDFTGT